MNARLPMLAAAMLAAGCATINSPDPADRLRVARALVAQEDVYVGVLTAKYPDVRNELAARVVGEARCAELVRRTDLEASVREKLVGRIGSQETLAAFARDGGLDERLRKAAVLRLSDQTALSRVARDAKAGPGLRAAAVERLRPAAAAAVLKAELQAVPAPENWICGRLVPHVEDGNVLADAALDRRLWDETRANAFAAIGDAGSRKRVFFEASDDWAARTALAAVAAADPGALEEKTGQARLLDLFRSVADDALRAEIMRRLSPDADLGRLSDQARIAAALRAAPTSRNLDFAERKLFDEGVLRSLALGEDRTLATWATDSCAGEETVLAIALGARSTEVRVLALARLDERTNVEKVASECTDSAVRKIAIGRLDARSNQLLERLAKDADPDVARKATERLRTNGAKKKAAKIAQEAKEAEAERIRRERAEEEARKRRESEEDRALQDTMFRLLGAAQVRAYRIYLQTLEGTPGLGPKSFQFSGTVRKAGRSEWVLAVPDGNGGTFETTVSFKNPGALPAPRPAAGTIATVQGVYDGGTRNSVRLKNGVFDRIGFPGPGERGR